MTGSSLITYDPQVMNEYGQMEPQKNYDYVQVPASHPIIFVRAGRMHRSSWAEA